MCDIVVKPETCKYKVRLALKTIILMIYLNCGDSLYQLQLYQLEGDIPLLREEKNL